MHTREPTNAQLAELIRSHIQAMRGEMNTRFEQLDGRVDDLQASASYLDERMERTEKKVTQNNRRLKKLGEIGRRVTAGDYARSG